MDQLAAEGLRFTSGYCSASTCTPTRYSLLTGTYAFRYKGTGIAPPNSPAIIQPGTKTIASILQRAGYATGVVGKWHLGLGGEGGRDWNGKLKPGPLEIGFDTCSLLPTTNDRVPQVYVHDHRVPNLDPADPLWVGKKKPSPDHPTGLTLRDTLKMDWSHGHNSTIHNGISRIGFYTGGHAARFRDEDLADKWLEKSIEFIERHKDRPFFLFFSSHDIHVPRMPHERFQGKTTLGYRGDAIVQLDWCVGELMTALDRLKLAENTLVVFCSDNGPVLDDGYKDDAIEKIGTHRAAGHFTGGKYSVYEGGTRTPFITRWKGRIKPGLSEERKGRRMISEHVSTKEASVESWLRSRLVLAHTENAGGKTARNILVPMLCVGTQGLPLCGVAWDAKRPKLGFPRKAWEPGRGCVFTLSTWNEV